VLVTACEDGVFAILFLPAVYPIRPGTASFRIKLNGLQSLAYTHEMTRSANGPAAMSRGFRQSSRPLLQVTTAIRAALFHFGRTGRAKGAFITANPGIAIFGQGLHTSFAFFFHFQCHDFYSMVSKEFQFSNNEAIRPSIIFLVTMAISLSSRRSLDEAGTRSRITL